MGVTIKCKKTGREIDLGCGGFMNLRRKVAQLMGEPFYSHYEKLCNAPIIMQPEVEEKVWKDTCRKPLSRKSCEVPACP